MFSKRCTISKAPVLMVIVHVLLLYQNTFWSEFIDVCSLTPQNLAWNRQCTDNWTH